MTYRHADAASIEELFQQIQERSYNKELLQVSFSGVEAKKVSVRPGDGGDMTVISVIGSSPHSEGVYADAWAVGQYLRNNPNTEKDILDVFNAKLKKYLPQIKKQIADHYENPSFNFHLLSAVFGYQDAKEWANVSNVKVTNVKVDPATGSGRLRFLSGSWTATVTFTAKKKAAATAVFSAMSDRELDALIEQWENSAPENFWMDGELRMSRRDAYKMYRQQWRAMSPRDQQAMMNSLKSSYGRYASADRVASSFMAANDEVTAGSDGNYMTKQNLFLLHRMSEMLYKGIPHGKLLPDWAESKINSAAEHLKSVAGWAMYESHGDELHHGPEANPIHLASRYLEAKGAKLDAKTKQLVNRSLIKAGLDGNKRFRSAGEALAKAGSVLAEHGLEWDEVINGFRLNQPNGHVNVRLALTNQEDSYSPTSVENTSLAFFWDTLETGVEAIAYLG